MAQSTCARFRPTILRLWLFLLSSILYFPMAAHAQGTVTPTWTFRDAFTNTLTSKLITVQRLSAVGNAGNLISIGNPGYGRTTNSSFTTNLYNGFYYRVTISAGFDEYSITNFFDANTTGAVDGGDPLYRAFGQPQDRTVFAPSLPYALAIFGLKVGGVFTNPAVYGSIAFRTNGGESAGWVWTLTNTATGQGDWAAPTGGGGGSGDVVGPSASTAGELPYFDLTTGKHLGRSGILYTSLSPWANWNTNAFLGAAFKGTNAFDLAGSWIAATNGYPWGSLYDPAGSSSAVQSALDAFKAIALTNFDTKTWTNSSTAGVTITNLGDGANTNLVYSDKNGRLHRGAIGSGLTWNAATETLSAPTGGSGTVTSVGLTGPADMTISGSPVTGSGILGFLRTANVLADFNGQTLSNINSIVVGAGSITNTSLTANTMVKADANKKIVSATAGTDFVSPGTTLTINGTSLQITSSAGAQDLSASRTWTLSFPNAMTIPGTLNVTSDQTNQGNLSITGNTTNFGSLTIKTGSLNPGSASFALGVTANGQVTTNSVPGGGSGTVTAGTNIVVDSSSGANTVSLKDPATLGQINITTAWLTNAVTPTNSFAGTVVDMSKAENGITNLTGNLTFTGVANITSGALNSAIVTLIASSSSRTIDVADASMHKETNWNTTLPAGWMMEVMVRVYPGIRTNFYQIITP